jgi:hypothetical protein
VHSVTSLTPAAEALVTATAPTEKTVIKQRIKAIILFIILVFFMVFTPFVVLLNVSVEFVKTFFMAVAPFFEPFRLLSLSIASLL